MRGRASLLFSPPLAAALLLALATGRRAAAREAEPGPLRAGAALRVITPDPLLPVSGGMGPTSPVREKRGELTARALVVEASGTRVAIVSADVIGFPSVLGDRARRRIRSVPPRNVLIAATHTHSAPDMYAFPDGRGGHTGDLDWIDLVTRRVAEAVEEAAARLAPARLRVATGRARGKIAYNYYAPALYDPTCGVIQLTRVEGGSAIATLVNYAVHPEVLGPDAGILSPDLVGPLCERIEAEAGGLALFVNSAQGGMVTADNRDLARPRDALRAVWEDRNTWEECARIGGALAGEALRIVRDAPVRPEAALRCRTLDVEFPVESEAMWRVVTGSPLRYPRDAARHSITTRLARVDLGPARILTIPGEALPNIGLYLRRRIPGPHDFLFGLTNDAFGYILTRVDFASFERYEYISRVSLGEHTGEIYLEKALELMEVED